MIENRIDEHAERIEQLLRDVHYQLIRLSRHELRDEGITPPRFHTLYFVVRNGPVDMGTMHTQMHLSKSSLTSLVDGLVDDGLLRRERSPDDRRRVVLNPTKAGVELLERLRLTRCRHLQNALDRLEAPSAQCVADSLHLIVDELGQRTETEVP